MDFLKGITPQNGAVLRSEVKDKCTLRVGGSVVLTKNGLIRRYNFWADADMSGYEGYFECSDWDWECEYTDHSQAKIGDLPIDNLNDFVNGLRNNGLSTLASTYEFSDDEIKKAVFDSIAEMKRVKTFFGKGIKCYNALPEDEKLKVRVDWVITNYATMSDYRKKDFGIEFDTENLTAPTLEQLIEYRSKL